MANAEKGWTLVNTKQKKAESAKKRKERKAKENAVLAVHKKKFESDLIAKSYSGFVPVDKSEPVKNKKPKKKYLPQADRTESETLFSAFSEVEQKKMMTKQALQQLAQKEGEENKPKKKKKSKKVSAKSVCETWDAEQLKLQLEGLPARFPNHHELQLKSLAEVFEERLGVASLGSAKAQEEKTFERKLEIPLCYLPDSIATVTVKWLQTIPEKNLASFCLWLIKEAHSTVKRKSSSAIGLKMLIQLLCSKFPAVSVRCVNSTAFQERFCVPVTAWEEVAAKVGPEAYTRQHKNLSKILPTEGKVLRPAMIHTLVWFLGQPLKDAPSTALSYWLQFLLPLLCIPIPDDVYDLVFTYLNSLYPRKAALSKREFVDETAVAALERLIVLRASMDDKAFTNSPFATAYPFIEKFTLWSSKQSINQFFPMLLRHAGIAPKARRDEILEKLVICLSKDPACYERWQTAYPSFVAQSSNLVLYITESWERLTTSSGDSDKPLLDSEKILELVNEFLSINKQIQEGTYKLTGKQAGKKLWAKRDIEVCNVTCKKLTSSVSSKAVADKPTSGSTYIFYMFVLLLLAAGLAFYVRKACGDGKCSQEWCAVLFGSCQAALHKKL